MSEVIIIGGGVIGAFAAYYLHEKGWDVTIVEKGEFGHGSSHGNCGMISPDHIFPLNMPGMVSKALGGMIKKESTLFIPPEFDMGRFKWLLRFALSCNETKAFHAVRARLLLLGESVQRYESLIEKEGLECQWKRNGLLALFLSREQLQGHNATRRLEQGFGVESSLIDGQDLKVFLFGLEDGIAGGYLYESTAHLRPDDFMREMKKVLTGKGVEIIEHTQVVSFRAQGGRAAAAVTACGDFEADAFVLAAGAWTPFFNKAIGAALPIQPGKGYSVTIKRPAPCPAVPCFFKEQKVAVAPWESGYRIGGTIEFSGYDAKLNKARINSLIKGHGTYFPAMGFDENREDWCGLRPMTYDGLPIIDYAPALGNVIIAAGHNMVGMAMGPATGKMVTAMLCGESPGVDIAPFRCGRF